MLHRRKSAGRFLVGACLLLGFATFAFAGAWVRMASPPGEGKSAISTFIVDAKGTPWATAQGGVYWWNGKKWVQAKNGYKPFKSGYYPAILFGGPDRGAYLSQVKSGQHRGLLYKLEAGRVEKVCDFYCDFFGERPGIYVSRSGELFNYGRRFVSVRKDGRWQTVETKMRGNGDFTMCIIDFGSEGPVVFISSATGKAALWDGRNFHTDLLLPSPPGSKNYGLKACRWGKRRMLLWRPHSVGCVAAELVENNFKPISVADITKHIGNKSSISDAWTAPDGSGLLYFNRHDKRSKRGSYLSGVARILADGTITNLGTRKPDYWNNRWINYPNSILLARNGVLWFGHRRAGISRFHNGHCKLFDWRQAVTALDIDRLFQAPDGAIYAAARSVVYRWDPEAKPDRSLTQEWEQIIDESWHGPGHDLAGNLWVFRDDKPNKISRWDGRTWLHRPVPFHASKALRITFDDRGRIVVQMISHPDGVYVIDEDKPLHFKDIRDAFVHCVKTGSRQFKSTNIIGPVVQDDGRIWFAYTAHRSILAYLDGRWEALQLGEGLRDIRVDKKKRILFFTKHSVWIYRKGQLVKLPKLDNDAAALFRLSRRKLSLPPGTKLYETYVQYRSYPAPDGGCWIYAGSPKVYRLLGKALVKIDCRGTPLEGRSWRRMGLTPSGALWIATDQRTRGTTVFLRKPIDQAAQPRVRFRKFEIKNSRRVRFTCNTLPKAAAAVLWRTNLDSLGWRLLDKRDHWFVLRKPGKYEIRIEARAMDTLGVLGPATVHTAVVNVKLPRTRWTEKPPKHVGDLVWVAPVAAEWTAEDIPRRIEWRVAGEKWRPLPADRRIHVAKYNNKGVEFQFRAVEENEFIDPEPLSAKIAVEMPLEDVVRRRIVLILTGTDAKRKQAIEDLKAVPVLSRRLLQEQHRLLQEEMRSERKQAEKIRRALEELGIATERPKPQPSPDINALDQNGATRLHAAASKGQVDVAKFLIAKGADVNVRERNWAFTPLHMAAKMGHKDMIELLLANGADVQTQATGGLTPLDVAVLFIDRSDVVKLLVVRGGDFNYLRQDGRSPLHRARPNVAEWLINRGADVNTRDKKGSTLLHYAVRDWHMKNWVDLLLQKGADIKAVNNDGATPLHFAAEAGHNDFVKLLIDKGAEVNAPDKKGWTPLHYARCQCKSAELLIGHGANVKAVGNNGETPMHVAASKGQFLSVKVFIAAGVDVNVRDNDGLTPMHYAARVFEGCEAMFVLIRKGADIEAVEKSGKTPLHLAAQAGHAQLVKSLIIKKANVNARDNEQKTPLALATNKEVRELLEKNGAKE